ncbi:MAG TPA: vWA domain-containing protein [Acidimicrobiales bacterium]|nr:vWA domain-containing protein [Acidimicrobiales bacterium]
MTGVRVLRRLAGLVLLALMMAVPSAFAAPGVQPTVVDTDADPGTSFDVTKTVTTEEIPPNPDIVFLADTTGSMGPAIGNVKTNINNIIADVEASQPTAQFGVAQYRDREHCPADPFDVRLDQAVTDDNTLVVNAVNALALGDGCDFPENGLVALTFLATDPTVGYRADSTRIVVWFGDAPQHVDGNGPTVADTIAALQAAGIRVIAIDVGALDSTGQATAITDATGGVLLPGGGDVSGAILAGLSSLPVEVTPEVVSCDTGLSASFDPASQTVTSGDDAVFTETVTVAADAPQGSTLSCTVRFLIDGEPAGDAFTQSISVDVNDVTAPVAACTATVNPAGKTVPAAGNNPKSGQNPDGFYELTATDAVDPNPQIFVVDTGSGTVFGPFPSGTRIKYTEDATATPEQKGMGGPNSAVTIHIIGTGDAAVHAVDASGNQSAPVACLVPGPPK